MRKAKAKSVYRFLASQSTVVLKDNIAMKMFELRIVIVLLFCSVLSNAEEISSSLSWTKYCHFNGEGKLLCKHFIPEDIPGEVHDVTIRDIGESKDEIFNDTDVWKETIVKGNFSGEGWKKISSLTISLNSVTFT